MCKLVDLERIFGGLDQLGGRFLDKYHIKCQLRAKSFVSFVVN